MLTGCSRSSLIGERRHAQLVLAGLDARDDVVELATGWNSVSGRASGRDRVEQVDVEADDRLAVGVEELVRRVGRVGARSGACRRTDRRRAPARPARRPSATGVGCAGRPTRAAARRCRSPRCSRSRRRRARHGGRATTATTSTGSHRDRDRASSRRELRMRRPQATGTTKRTAARRTTMPETKGDGRRNGERSPLPSTDDAAVADVYRCGPARDRRRCARRRGRRTFLSRMARRTTAPRPIRDAGHEHRALDVGAGCRP